MSNLKEQAKAINIDLDLLLKQSLQRIEDLLKSDMPKEAEMVAKQLLKVEPQNIQTHQLLGLSCYKQRKYKEGIEYLETALKLDNENPENYNNIALCYLYSNRFQDALPAVSKAVEMRPKSYDFLNNLALVQRALGMFDESIATLQKSIELNTTESRTWENLGSVYGQIKKYDKAIECFQKSLEINPENDGAHVDLAYAYHLTNQWDKAWEHYEHRLKYWHTCGRTPGRFYEIYPPDKQWNGTDNLEGKTIVVYCEQGTGDILNFVRFVPQLSALGGKVILDVPESLQKLLEGFGQIRTSLNNEVYDYSCSFLSLPYLLNVKDYEGDKPYLNSSIKLNMSDYENDYKIGIVWAGNPGHPNDANRSCKLSFFKPLLNIPGVKLFSLQKEIHKRSYIGSDVIIDLTEGCDDMSLVNMTDVMNTFDDTAAVIEAMDLIITVDTSVLHLAGAIGKKTFALIPFNPDWRWMAEGEITPWYDSVKLIRQESFGNWEPVFEQVIKEVNEIVLQNQ